MILLFKVLRRILNHPLSKKNKLQALLRFIKWHIGIRLLKSPIVYSFTTDSYLIIQRGMEGATGNIYNGLDEFYDMSFLLHFLRENDFFVDVGANIGSYTVLASAHIGCTSISIEPSRESFHYLQTNIRVNDIDDNVEQLNIGLGSKSGKEKFTYGNDTTNHVATNNDKNVITIEVDTLDNVVSTIKKPTLVKIDVEGYEKEVLLGASKALASEYIKAIIIEDVNHGERYGFQDNDVHKILNKCGFKRYEYDPFKRELNKKSGYFGQNTIYLRDFDYVNERIKKAPKIIISGIKI